MPACYTPAPMTVSRRGFLSTLAVGPFLFSSARAQAKTAPRVGVLSGLPSADIRQALDTFREELRKLGWTINQNVTLLQVRSAEGRNERLPDLAAEVLNESPEVVVVLTAPATRALQQLTATVPIVMWGVGDPVEYGLVANLVRPGANVTGTSALVNEVAGKLVELLREVAPGAGSCAVFSNPGNAGAGPYSRAAQTAGQALSIRVQSLEVRTPDDFDAAFGEIARQRLGAIIVPPEPLVRSQRRRVVDFAARQRIPLLFHGPPGLLQSGGLLAFAAKAGHPRIVASYVDRILKGARPAELPVHQPTEFELAVNVQTAKVLGLSIPRAVVVRADRIIE